MENLGTRVASVTNTSWQLLHLHKQMQPQLLIHGYSQLAQQHTFLITSIHLRGKYVESYTRMKEKFGDPKGRKSQKDRLYNGQRTNNDLQAIFAPIDAPVVFLLNNKHHVTWKSC